MRKAFWFTCGLPLLVITLLTGCATLFYRGNVGYETTIINPDGTIVWAPAMEYDGDGSAKARTEADSIAKQAATSRKTQQVAVWQFAGYDYQFNKMDLSNAIAKGTHRLGKQITQGYRLVGPKVEGGGIGSNPKITVGDPYELEDPSKPATYYTVEVKTYQNKTVDVLDNEEYNRVYNKSYQQLYERYHNEYVAMREHAAAYISAKMEGEFADLPDDMVLYPANGGKLTGKEVKSILQKRLAELAPGSVLVNGGFYDDLVIVASIVNDVFECKLAK